MHRKLIGAGTMAAMVVAAIVTSAGMASGVGAEHGGVVGATPTANTPHVLDGDVLAVAEVGNVVVLGGRFTQAQNPAANSTPQARTNLLAFNKSTGELLSTFAPALDGTVRTVVAAADGQSVFVGGQFGQLDGSPAYKLVKLSAQTGQRVPGFNPPIIDAAVMDLTLHGDRLFAGGNFTTIGGQPRSHLAEFDPQTGALRPGINSTFAGTVWNGVTHVYKIDVTPDGDTMVVTGNFRTVDGQTRVEIALMDLTASPATVTSWRTTKFEIRCGSANSTHFSTRDVEFAPDGEYFVIGATGGHPPQGGVCDGVTRWETDRSGSGQEPTWFAPTGGDSVYSVSATGTAVYAGGHFRWFNNPVYVQSFKGPGAVDREGIAALDPANGIPLTWDPGRDRGRAVWDFLSTGEGLWVGSDTDRIARYLYRGRIAYFPVDHSWVVPQPTSPQLPVMVNRAGSVTAPNGVVARHFDGSVAGSQASVDGAGTGWTGSKAVFVAGEKVYTGKPTGGLTVRSYDGETYGSEQNVDLYGLTAFSNEVIAMTAGFYHDGHIYFTTSANNALYRRGLSAESDIVGAERRTVTAGIAGVDWRQVRGMFVAGDHLYWVSSVNGSLNRINWAGDRPVAGTNTVVNNSVDWGGGAVFATQAPTAPNAIIDVSCTGLRCQFDGTGSNIDHGSITGYSWNFGDGNSSTEEAPLYIYDEPGTYTVTLQVTSDAGLSDSASEELVVEPPPASSVEFVEASANTAQTTTNSRSVTIPESVDEGDTLLLFASANSGGSPLQDPSGWERVGDASTTGASSAVWSRTATSSDAGSSVAVATSTFIKADVVVAAYRGAELVDGGSAMAPETTTTAHHATPVVDVTVEGSWLVSYWADKSAATTAWSVPSGHTQRHQSAGTGAGHVSELLADSNGPMALGQAGGLTASADSAQVNAAMASIVLAPAD